MEYSILNNIAKYSIPSSHFTRVKRQGVTIMVVLALVSITLSLSYAMIRSQTTSEAILTNLISKGNARHAAVTGMMVALRKMHKSSWAGVDTSIGAFISETESYAVTFETGDPLLSASDSDYTDYPYRVTLTSTGYSYNPIQPSQVATHVIQTVVQLIPRKFSDEPASWNAIQDYTVFQWADRRVEIQIPVRIEGSVFLQGRLNLCTEYPPYGEPRERFLADLEMMRVDGLDDCRPFNGPVNLPFNRESHYAVSLLQNELNLTAIDIPEIDSEPVSFTNIPNSYQLYPGGKTYSFQIIDSSLDNISLEPDPITNPLGIILRNGTLDVNDNVTIQGTLITEDTGFDVNIRGENVQIKPFNLRPVEGSLKTIQLPAVISSEDLDIEDFSSGSLQGMAICKRYLRFKRGGCRSQIFVAR